MAKIVINGAVLQCTMGLAPGTLSVLPTNQVNGMQQPVATIMDFQPMVNIASFGMCQSPANPQVAAATAAAMGVLTPMPCVPMTVAPWQPGAIATKVNQLPVLLATDQCMCTWAGQITVTTPGQTLIDSE